jgi:hypothetical protein
MYAGGRDLKGTKAAPKNVGPSVIFEILVLIGGHSYVQHPKALTKPLKVISIRLCW